MVLVVRIWCFHCRGPGSIPGRETDISCKLRGVAKIKKKKKMRRKKEIILSDITSGITFLSFLFKVLGFCSDEGGLGSCSVFITDVSLYVLGDHLFLYYLADEVGGPNLERQMDISREINAYGLFFLFSTQWQVKGCSFNLTVCKASIFFINIF